MDNSLIFQFIISLFQKLVLFGGAFFLLWYYLKATSKRTVQADQGNADHATILPLRLQAYERLVLLLERIHPSNLVMRINNPELTALQLQALLVRTIREEFDYNLSQQLYISVTTWEMMRNAREETIAMINQAVSGLPGEAMSSQLIQALMDASVSRGKLPVEMALEELKKELQRIF